MHLHSFGWECQEILSNQIKESKSLKLRFQFRCLIFKQNLFVKHIPKLKLGKMEGFPKNKNFKRLTVYWVLPHICAGYPFASQITSYLPSFTLCIYTICLPFQNIFLHLKVGGKWHSPLVERSWTVVGMTCACENLGEWRYYVGG